MITEFRCKRPTLATIAWMTCELSLVVLGLLIPVGVVAAVLP